MGNDGANSDAGNIDDPLLLDELRLSLTPGIGPRTRQSLIEHFGSATAALAAAPSALREVAGVGPKLTRALLDARDAHDIGRVVQTCREREVRLFSPSRPGYPAPLVNTPDPPGILYVRGTWTERDALAIAIVGSRHATPYGTMVAHRLASSLARAGLTIVSGLARGVDAAAHRGALEAGGRTLAVLGSGVLHIYPPEHVELAEDVIRGGALISEAPLHAQPTTGSFPQRNRLISGLSLGVIVVEASDRSGALITARHATEQGRDVFAVPGRIDNRMSHGCHKLLRDGAILVESADDVLEALGPLPQVAKTETGEAIHHPAELMLNEIEKAVLAAVDTQAGPIDTIVTKSGLSPAQVLSTLSVLEIRRLIRRVSGSLVMRL